MLEDFYRVVLVLASFQQAQPLWLPAHDLVADRKESAGEDKLGYHQIDEIDGPDRM